MTSDKDDEVLSINISLDCFFNVFWKLQVKVLRAESGYELLGCVAV